MDNALSELEKLTKGGIRFSVTPTSGGYRVQIGEHLTEEAPCVHTGSLEEAVGWLREQAKHRYPDSPYSKGAPHELDARLIDMIKR